MSTSQKTDQSKKLSIAVAQAKPMLAAVMGAVIGCGASLHIYYTLLGGAEQNRRLAQVESTVEHNRLVSEEALDTNTERPHRHDDENESDRLRDDRHNGVHFHQVHGQSSIETKLRIRTCEK